jgi:hypothetical protein
MPTKLGEPYSPLWRGRYPHMLPEDFPVWERYIDGHASDFTRLYYDVRVGGPKEIDPKVAPSPSMRKMWYDVNAKRIDVIGEKEDEIWIIEVTTTPGLRALGQLTTYIALWWDDPKIDKPAVPVLMAESIDADILRAMETYGMRGIEIR